MAHITYLETHPVNGSEKTLTFWCPGCKSPHSISVGGPKAWYWNFDRDRPTFSPSVLSNGGRECPDLPRCHSYVENGMIRFLSDCDHELAGKTVPLEAW